MTLPRTHPDQVAAAAARLTGTPPQLAARLRALLDEGPPRPNPRESADARREREAEAQAHDATVAALRHRLASDFVTARGWRLTPAPLAVKELARRASPGGNWHKPAREWLGTMFHPSFYRGADRRAAAMVAHPLAEQVERDRAAIEDWAAERGLAVSFPDFPSWHDPLRRVVAVFEPAASDEAAEPIRTAAQPSAAPAVPTPRLPPAPTPAPALDDMRLDAPAGPAAAVNGISTVLEAPVPAAAADTAAAAVPVPPAMRPIAPIDLDGIVPRDLADEEDPHFAVVDPRELLIDEAYQRDLGPKSLALIRRIVEGWSWSRYKVPNCVWVDGRLHVVDGQHTAIAAASHPGIQAILVLVSIMPEVADRAAAFVSHATNRLQATQVQLHRAALTAGDGEAVALDAVCRAAGVAARRAQASTRAADLAPVIAALQAQGVTSLARIAAALTERGIPTSRGAERWSPMQVSRVMKAAAGGT